MSLEVLIFQTCHFLFFTDRSRSEVDLSNPGEGFSEDPLMSRCRSVPGLNDGVDFSHSLLNHFSLAILFIIFFCVQDMR